MSCSKPDDRCHIPFLGRGTFGSGWQRQKELGDSAFQSESFEIESRAVLVCFPVPDSCTERGGWFGDSSSTSSSSPGDDGAICSSGNNELLGLAVTVLLAFDTGLGVSSGMILDLNSGSGWMAHRWLSASFERAGSKGSTRWKDIWEDALT